MLHWTLAALLDSREAFEYVAADNERAAQRLLDKIIVAANRLDRFPRLGRPGSESGTRQLVVPGTSYTIFYRIVGNDEVELLRVLHGARKWPP